MSRRVLLSAAVLLVGCDLARTVSDGADSTVDPAALASHEVRDASTQAFAQPYRILSATEMELHRKGDAAFEAIFVPGTGIQGGLGPLFHTNSCISCHAADGRGTPPAAGETPTSLLLRASLPGPAGVEPVAVEGFGTQLQPRAVAGEEPEVRIAVVWTDSVDHLPDGTAWALRRPVWTVSGGSAPFPAQALVGARLAPPVFGLGALEAVSDAEILSREDPTDADGDGISGRANRIATAAGTVLGRFGWKANTPDLLTQAAAAYRNDMGITNPVFPTEPCRGWRASCGDHPVEVDSSTLAAAVFYTRTLAAPVRRATELPDVRRGETLFRSFRCGACHVPELPYAAGSLLPGRPAGIARAFTDLLLHDMGEALADHRPDHDADGREWRTTPLWGIGLTETVHGRSFFLHDGRARSLEEAILWHGGEAEASRESWRGASRADREALVTFLRSL